MIDVKEPPELVRPYRDRFNWTFPVWLDREGIVASRFAPVIPGVAPDVSVINAHYILGIDRKILHRDFLNVAQFDPHAGKMLAELERLTVGR